MRWFHPESRQKTSFIKAAVMIYFRCIFLLSLVVVGVSSQRSIPPITLVVNANGKLHCVISNDTSNSAIAFIEDGTRDEIVTEHDPNANICMVNEGGDPFGCLEDNSLIKKYHRAVATQDFVPDRRRESFRTIKTQKKDAYTFSDVVEIPNGNFNITISTRVKDGHILLCNSDPPNKSHCYWFIIDGWGGSKTAMRRCENDISTQPKIYPKTCDIVEKNITNLTSLSTWSHLRIEMVGNNISLYKFGKRNPILTYTDSDPIPVRYMTFRSPNYDGFWKVHQYNFVEVAGDTTINTRRLNLPANSSNVCVAVYLNLCPNCKADITLLNSKLNSLDTKAVGEEGNIKEDNWAEIQLVTNQQLPSDSFNLQIRVSQTHGQKWYFGDILECNRNDIRKITTNSNKELCCQIVNSEWKLCKNDITSNVPTSTTATSSSCPPNTIGKYCLPCTLFGSCENYKYCNFETDSIVQCHCATRGFKGSSCNQKCSNKTYGDGCEESCDRCLKECSHDNGQCIGGCMPNLDGDFCESFLNPVLKQQPHTERVGNTNVTLKIYPAYDGNVPPTAYIVQLKEREGAWKQAAEASFSYSTRSAFINNLKQETFYYVRILLRTMNGDVYSDDKYIPTATFETKCTELSREDLKVVVKGQTLSVKIKDSVNTCKIENYNYERSSYNLPISNVIKDLDKCVENNIKIIKVKSTYSFNFSVKAGENNGEDLQCPNVNQTQNSAILKWDYHGDKSVAYQIKYRESNLQKINCIRGYSTAFENYPTVETTNVSLHNLRPYILYTVRITPIAKDDSKGKFRDIRFTTKASDALVEESIIMNYSSSDRQLDVTTQVEDCAKVSGPIDFSLELKCESDWCLNDTQIYNESNFLFFKHFSFLITEFTNYTLLATIKRNNSEKKFTKDFTTNGTSPGPVRDPVIYSKTGDGMSLRWKQPYPPMGKLKHYLIKYRKTRYRSVKDKNCDPKECPLYPGYHCCSITDLSHNEEYLLEICAFNEDVKNCGSFIHLKGTPAESQPHPPAYIQLVWKNHQNLTVEFPHPNITNGPLKSYSILMDGTSYVNENIFEERPTYTHEILKNSEPAKVIKVRVSVSNSAGTSGFTEKMTISPPPAPKLLSTGATNLTIGVPKFDLKDAITSSLLAFVIDKKSIYGPADTEKKNFKIFNIDNHGHLGWLAIDTVLKPIDDKHWKIVIGTDKTTEPVYTKAQVHDRKLSSDTEYDIIIVSITVSGNVSTTTNYTISAHTTLSLYQESSRNNLYLLLLFILPGVCIIGFVVLRLKGIKIALPTRFLFSTREDAISSTAVSYTHVEGNIKTVLEKNKFDEKHGALQSKTATYDPSLFSRPIQISQLEEYIKSSFEKGHFEEQFERISVGKTKPWTIGVKSRNRKKNRDENIIAYDHTRVKLNVENNASDYINANYIKGCNGDKTYIAAQTPMLNTIVDFWHMIWQENVKFLIMLATELEIKQKVITTYWPHRTQKYTVLYGDIEVTCTKKIGYRNLEERTFLLICHGERKTITQYHFLSWTTNNVFSYIPCLTSLLSHSLELGDMESPLLVHCSDGVSRTGTFILAHICLQIATNSDQIDVLFELFKLRQQRVNMVYPVEGYKMVHLLLLKSLAVPKTALDYNGQISDSINELLDTPAIKEQMSYIDRTMWQDKFILSIEMKSSSPNVQVLINEDNYVFSESYYVQGYKTPEKFIVTAYPLPNTIDELWQLILQRNIKTMICFNELLEADKSNPFYPNDDRRIIKLESETELHYISKTDKKAFIIYHIQIIVNNESHEPIPVRLFQYKDWFYNILCPANMNDFLTLINDFTATDNNEKPILIACRDGIRASGLFTAMYFLIQQMKMEFRIDVPLAVRVVRLSKKEFVRDLGQFKFLYRSCLHYLRMFDIYSNDMLNISLGDADSTM